VAFCENEKNDGFEKSQKPTNQMSKIQQVTKSKRSFLQLLTRMTKKPVANSAFSCFSNRLAAYLNALFQGEVNSTAGKSVFSPDKSTPDLFHG
jgi:hypothetical protein